ncbi:MAG: UMP kinase [bacterium]
MENKETIVISLGGSIVIPELPDPEFIKTFCSFIISEVDKGKRFVIIVGGGKTCRHYQDALGKIIDATVTDRDWIGIYSTHLNAQLIRMSFGKYAAEHVVVDPSVLPSFTEPIVIGAGWKPGWSTDYDAIMMAEQVSAKKVINLSNIDYAYDKDPKKYPDARKLEKVSWSEYRSFIPAEWTSGLSTPFDPIASEKADSLGIEVAIMNGRNIENLRNYIDGKEFLGTVIK